MIHSTGASKRIGDSLEMRWIRRGMIRIRFHAIVRGAVRCLIPGFDGAILRNAGDDAHAYYGTGIRDVELQSHGGSR